MCGIERDFSDNRWATYRQIAAAGGHVRKGEHGEKIFVFDTTRRVPKKDAKGQPVIDADGRKVLDHPKLFSGFHTVFNVEQTEGLNLPSRDAPQADWQSHAVAEAVIDTAKVPMTHVQGDRAYYNPRDDQIVLPERAQFPSAQHLLRDRSSRARARDRPREPVEPRDLQEGVSRPGSAVQTMPRRSCGPKSAP